MKSSSPSRSSRRDPAPSRTRLASRRSGSTREAWITQPEALLAALEGAERSEREAREHLIAEMRHALEPKAEPEPELAEPVAPAPAPPADRDPLALPVLREDERLGHASKAGIVVIIRRRRAA